MTKKNINKKCDTIFADEYYKIINKNPLKSFKVIVPDTLKEKVIINSQVRMKYTYKINDAIKYCSYKDYQIGPDDDYEYFSINNKNYYVDLFYYSQMFNKVCFRSPDGLSAYKFEFKNYSYTAVFLMNSSVLMGHGYTMFLFASKINDVNSTELILFSKNLIAPDLRCFGIDEKENSLVYYDWEYEYSKQEYYEKTSIEENRIGDYFRDNLNITRIDNLRISYCK